MILFLIFNIVWCATCFKWVPLVSEVRKSRKSHFGSGQPYCHLYSIYTILRVSYDLELVNIFLERFCFPRLIKLFYLSYRLKDI